MAIYPESTSDRHVRASDLEERVTAIFRACGMSDEDAALLSRTLVEADLRGIHSHGTLRVPDYVKKLTVDGVNPRGAPRIVGGRGAAIVIDGDNAMGQITGTFAMKQAIGRAREHGLACAAVRGSNHCGAMDFYTLMATQEDMIGIAGTNALPTMAPWGGIDKIVGINPLSIAFPAEIGPAFVLDFAFGATAHGKIRVYHQKGVTIPEGWAFDRHGQPTRDPAAALEGLIQPIGGHKGVGLGMAVGMLSCLLSGAAYGTQSGNMIDGAKVGVDGQVYIAIDIAAFADLGEVKRRVGEIVAEVHASRRSAGVERLFVPGEIENEIAKRHATEGILLAAETLSGIDAAAARFGLPRADAPSSG